MMCKNIYILQNCQFNVKKNFYDNMNDMRWQKLMIDMFRKLEIRILAWRQVEIIFYYDNHQNHIEN